MEIKKLAVVADYYALKDARSFLFLQRALRQAGFDDRKADYIPTITDLDSPITPQALAEYAEQTLIPHLKKIKSDFVLGMGNNALCALGYEKKPAGVNKYRGKWLEVPTLGVPGGMTISPSMVLREPSYEEGFCGDLKYLTKCVAAGGKQEDLQMPVTIIDIEHPDQVVQLLKEAKYTQICSYDTETTGLDRDKDLVVSMSFCTGVVERDGSYRVYFWGGYDKLEPRFSKRTLKEFKRAFRYFFEQAENDPYTLFDKCPEGKFRLVGWNIGFDDWMVETMCIGGPEKRYDDPLMRIKQITLPGSAYDAMYLKWSVNNERPHDLKTAVHVYGGYPQYDAYVDEKVKETAARRGRILEHEDDFKVLKWLGVDPVQSSNKGGKLNFKWPKDVNKKACAFAMIDYPELRLYNCFDAVGTFIVFKELYRQVVNEDLTLTCQMRHIAHRRCLRAEQRGLLLDVEFNRATSKKLEQTIKQCKDEINKILLKYKKFLPLVNRPAKGKDPGGFNPGSTKQVMQVLYGDVAAIPVINRKIFYRRYSEESVEALCEAIEADVYGDFKDIKRQLRDGVFDAQAAMDLMQEYWTEHTNDATVLLFDEKLVGLGGLKYDPPARTKTGAPSASRSSLLTLGEQKPHNLLDLILMYNKAVKLKTSFIDKIYNCRDEWNLVRTSTNPQGTQSGRLSSSGNFNIQNLPKKLRGMFKARPGMIFVGLDYKSAEVYTLAAFSKDKALLKAIEAADTHRYVASMIYDKPENEITEDERQAGKMSVFLIVYGGGADKLAAALGISKSKAQWIIDTLLTKFPGIPKFMNEAIASSSVAPYYTYTAFGTRRSTKDILSNDAKTRSHVQRYAANHVIQGSAGEMCIYKIEVACCRTTDEGEPVFFGITVHDSELFETWAGKEQGYAWLAPKRDKNGKKIYVRDKDGNKIVDKKTNKPVVVTEIKGRLPELLAEITAEKVPFKPLDRVTFKSDIDGGYYWDGEPSLEKALDDKRKGGFRFDLLPKLEDNTYRGVGKASDTFDDEGVGDFDGTDIPYLAQAA